MKTTLWSKKSPKEKILRSITFLTLLSVALSVAAWAIASAQKQDPKSADTTRSKTLREKALEQDVEIDMREGHFDREYSDLRTLAKHSDAIVVGRLLKEESYFSGDNHITTIYTVDVQQVIKDGTSEAGRLSQSVGNEFPTPLTTPLRFTRFGGAVQLNGHRASVRMKGSELLTSNNTYVLFLQWTGRNYHIAGGMSGAVLVDGNFRTKPLGTNQALKLKSYDKLNLRAFIEEILKEPAS
jgi:hypothetical protein